MRYTESRLSPIAMHLLEGIREDTVDFQDNYSGESSEPIVLPARYPNLLANGATGIAVGMATNIPPHNLGEVIDAVIFAIENPDAPIEDYLKIIKGPDFPTGGLPGWNQGHPRGSHHRPGIGEDAGRHGRARDPQGPHGHHCDRASLSGLPGSGARQDRRPGP